MLQKNTKVILITVHYIDCLGLLRSSQAPWFKCVCPYEVVCFPLTCAELMELSSTSQLIICVGFGSCTRALSINRNNLAEILHSYVVDAL